LAGESGYAQAGQRGEGSLPAEQVLWQAGVRGPHIKGINAFALIQSKKV